MIVKNEEKNLPRVLSSIKELADEVIVLDTGSTDRTVEIAESFGAKVYHFEWCDDFSAARNESLKYATKEYILWLDGDDEIEKTEHEKIKRHLSERPGSAYYLRLKNIMKDQKTEAIQLRMFPNKRGILFKGKIHEQVFQSIKDMNIPMSLCDATIIHHGYYDDTSMKEKLIRNRILQEKGLEERPDDVVAMFFLSRTLKGLNEFNEALGYIDRIIEKGEGDPDVRALDIFKITLIDKASILCSNGMMEDAILLLEKWEGVFSASNLINYTLGELYYKTVEYEKAYRRFLPLMDEDFRDELIPLDIRKMRKNLLGYLGVASLFKSDYSTAKRCFEVLITDEPQEASNYHYLALSEEKAGNVDKAIMICKKAMDIFEDDPLFARRLFLLYLDKGDFDRAMDNIPALNGFQSDLDVIAGCLLISCSRLSSEGINQYYSMIQKVLSMPVKAFPEDFPEVRERMSSLKEDRALVLFDRAIDVLMQFESSRLPINSV